MPADLIADFLRARDVNPEAVVLAIAAVCIVVAWCWVIAAVWRGDLR